MKKYFLLLIFIFIALNLSAVRIQDIQQDSTGQWLGQVVTLTGIVTVSSGTFQYDPFYIQDSVGPYSGILIYSTYYSVNVGDSVEVNGEVTEYYNKTEITNVNSVNIISSGNAVPAPTIVTTSQIATSNPDTAESYEGVFIGIFDVVVTDTALGYGEWEINDGTGPCRVDDEASYTKPALNDTILAIAGILNYSFDNYKLEPRGDNDIYYSFSGVGDVNITPKDLIENETIDLSLLFTVGFGSIERIQIILPDNFDYNGNYSLSGSGFTNANVNYNQDTLNITNANITSLLSGTINLNNITPQTSGIETLLVKTASAGDTLSFINIQPTLMISRSDGTIPLSLIRENNSIGVCLLLGEQVKISGILTAAGELGSKYYIQDNSAGMCVYNPGGGLSIGDSAIFEGTVDQWSGLTEISPVSVVSGPFKSTPIVAEVVTCSILELEGLNGIENYEGKLVRINNLLQTVPVFPQVENNMPISDGTGNFEVRIEVAEIAGKPVPPNGFSITGIVSQYCPDSPYTTGYQLMPRGLYDIKKGGAGSGFAESYLSSIPISTTGNIKIKLTSELDTILYISFEISDTSWQWTGNSNNVILPGQAVLDSISGNGIDRKYKIHISNLLLPPDSTCFISINNISAPDSTGKMTLVTETGTREYPTLAEIYSSPNIWSVNTIAEVQRVDSTGYPSAMVGEFVIVSGVVTGPSEIFNGGTTKTSFWIEDTSSGVNIFSSEDDGNTSFILGAEVVVRGTVTEYNGITEVLYSSPDSVTIMGFDRELPDTLLLLENEGLFELIEGRLVLIKNAIVTSLPLQSGSGLDFTIKNGRTLIAIRVSDDAELDLSNIEIGKNYNFVGIVGQYTYDIPASSGYQFLLRFNQDIVEVTLGNPTTEPKLTIYPNPVSFSQGDVLHFAINSPNDGKVTFKIFDMEGREIITLLENSPSGPQLLSWDGITNYGQNARIGVYIASLTYHTADGNEVSINKPVVVGTTLDGD